MQVQFLPGPPLENTMLPRIEILGPSGSGKTLLGVFVMDKLAEIGIACVHSEGDLNTEVIELFTEDAKQILIDNAEADQ